MDGRMDGQTDYILEELHRSEEGIYRWTIDNKRKGLSIGIVDNWIDG